MFLKKYILLAEIISVLAFFIEVAISQISPQLFYANIII